MSIAAKCAHCGAPYEERENLLTHKMAWFPTCGHLPLTADDVVIEERP